MADDEQQFGFTIRIFRNGTRMEFSVGWRASCTKQNVLASAHGSVRPPLLLSSSSSLTLVYAVGHMPFGKVDALRDQSNYAGQIFDRYHRTIAAHFYGHRCASRPPALGCWLTFLAAMSTSLRSLTRTTTTSVRTRRTGSPSSRELSRLGVRRYLLATSSSANGTAQVAIPFFECTI